MEEPYLDCNIISVLALSNTPDYFYQVDKIYYYNSLISGIIEFKVDSIQIPEFDIRDKQLLNGLDFDLINTLRIPILKRVVDSDGEYWKIDLKYYEDYKLRSYYI